MNNSHEFKHYIVTNPHSFSSYLQECLGKEKYEELNKQIQTKVKWIQKYSPFESKEIMSLILDYLETREIFDTIYPVCKKWKETFPFPLIWKQRKFILSDLTKIDLDKIHSQIPSITDFEINMKYKDLESIASNASVELFEKFVQLEKFSIKFKFPTNYQQNNTHCLLILSLLISFLSPLSLKKLEIDFDISQLLLPTFYISRFPCLQELILHNLYFESWEWITDFKSTLQTLKITQNVYPHSLPVSFFTSLNECINLENLHLNIRRFKKNNITTETLSFLAIKGLFDIKKLPKLKCVKLEGNASQLFPIFYYQEENNTISSFPTTLILNHNTGVASSFWQDLPVATNIAYLQFSSLKNLHLRRFTLPEINSQEEEEEKKGSTLFDLLKYASNLEELKLEDYVLPFGFHCPHFCLLSHLSKYYSKSLRSLSVIKCYYFPTIDFQGEKKFEIDLQNLDSFPQLEILYLQDVTILPCPNITITTTRTPILKEVSLLDIQQKDSFPTINKWIKEQKPSLKYLCINQKELLDQECYALFKSNLYVSKKMEIPK